MNAIGLQIGAAGWRYSIVRESGQLGEELHGRELRDLIESLALQPPAAISVPWSASSASILDRLSEQGHMVMIGGSLSNTLRPALLPLVERLVWQERRLEVVARPNGWETVVFRRAAGSGDPVALLFLIDVDDRADRPVVVDASYFVGPVGTSAEAASRLVPDLTTEAPSQVSVNGARQQALRLHRLWKMGELEAFAPPDAVVAA